IADTLGMKEVMVPIHQGILSAYGLTSADMRVDVSQTMNLRSDNLDLTSANASLAALLRRALGALKDDGYKGEPITAVSFEMRYAGQNYSIEILVPTLGVGLNERALCDMYERFHAKHQSLYGYSIRDEIIEITDFNVMALGIIAKPELPKIRTTGSIKPRT